MMHILDLALLWWCVFTATFCAGLLLGWAVVLTVDAWRRRRAPEQ